MTKFELVMYTITEGIMRWLGKFFSWIFPLMAFLFAIGCGWRMCLVPTWPGKLFFLAIILILLFVGILLLIKRKKLWY